MKKTCIIKILSSALLCIQSFFLLSFSQQITPKFTRLSTINGLSQNTVFGILKDYKGFMWFATDEGLNKYDGYKFTVYKHNPEIPGSIMNNSLYAMMEDVDHNLWILTAAGLDRFDRMKESFIHYGGANNGAHLKCIMQDSKKRIWVGSTKGFYLLDGKKNQLNLYKNKAWDTTSNILNHIYEMTEGNNGEIWIGSRAGLSRFDPEKGLFTFFKNDPADSKTIGPGYVKAIFKDSKKRIWIGTTGSGIALFKPGDNSFVNFKNDPRRNSLGYNDILSFTEDNDGKLWIGTENGGISVFDFEKNNFVTYVNNENDEFSLSGNSVYSLYKDDIGNIWAGTWSGGVNFLPFIGDKFKHYKRIPNNSNSLTNNLVLSISDGPDGKIWIGTDGGGITSFDPVTEKFTSYQHNKSNSNSIGGDYVLALSSYAPGVLALGFHHTGMDLFDVKANVVTHYPLVNLSPNKINPPTINILYKDRQQNLWVGTLDNGGLFLFDKSKNNFTSFFSVDESKKNARNNSVYSLYETTSGELWAGEDKGVTVYNRHTKNYTHYQNEPGNIHSLSNNTVYSIMEDKAGNLWLGTARGLNFFNVKTKSFTVFTEKDGLPNNTIWSTQQDHAGNIWISTNNGLSRFNPVTKVFRNFTVNDGLQNNTFKIRASYQLPDGKMIFGGVNGFNTFYPDSIKDNDFVPPVYFTDFQVFNKPVAIGESSPLKQSINEAKEITLSYSQSVFTLEFAALNFTHPEQNTYAFKLEGFDKDWNYVKNKRTATYTNLDPGTYIFKVKGSNNDGVWNKTPTEIKIIVTPPFWRTWWFTSLLSLLVGGILLLIYRIRVSTIKKRERLLELQVQERTQQLAHSIQEEQKARQQAEQANQHLASKNKEVEQFAYIVSHDLQEPLRTTTSFIELLQRQYQGRLDEKADKYFSFIMDSSTRMKTLIKDLLDYSRIGAKKELVQADCDIIVKEVLADLGNAISNAQATITADHLPVLTGYTTELKQLFQNLLANAIKFRKKDIAPQIAVRVKDLGAYWQFSVKDNGIGIEAQYQEKIFMIFQRLHTKTAYEGSGIGLAHTKKIVELHGGKIWFESIIGEGTTFHFTIQKK